MRRYLTLIGLILIGLLAYGPAKQAQAAVRSLTTQQAESEVTLYFFWGDGCPHCAAQKTFLQQMEQKYPVKILAYEVWYSEENRKLLTRMTNAYGFEPEGIPVTFIGDRYWIGYNDRIGLEMEEAIKACLTSICFDAGQGIITPARPAAAPAADTVSTQSNGLLDLPVLGTVDLKSQSLLVSTALIAFVDGFNPCSLWVLSILLALTLRTGSRKRIFVIGLVFITITSLIYMLFIAGLFTVFAFVSFMGWIQVLVALVALFFAAVNIKDYFWYKEGISFTIDDAQKPGIFQRMRNVLNAESMGAMVGATVVMSAGVSMVEFACTAGFPVLWANLLAAQRVEPLIFALLLAVYMVIYQLDELGIFLIAVFTLKSNRMEEKHGRILKLIGGSLMLTLAAVMLIEPTVMNDISGSLAVFGVAFGIAALALVVHRYLLPRWGIVIGTEELPTPGRRAQRRRPRA